MPTRPTPHCPRCRYDLSGDVATWTDSCPAWGRCPECGADFRWSDAFLPYVPPLTTCLMLVGMIIIVLTLLFGLLALLVLALSVLI